MRPTVHFASDHAGLELKRFILTKVREAGYSVVDHGPAELNNEDDFTDYIPLAARAMLVDPSNNRALVFGGSGQGEAMAANRLRGARAAVYYGGSKEIVKLSRTHNDANILSIGARFVGKEEALRVSLDWLQTVGPTVKKYHRRNQKLDTLNISSPSTHERTQSVNKSSLIPAIIPRSLKQLEAELARVPFVESVQIDLVDGQFVPFVSWPYDPAGTPSELSSDLFKEYLIEVDLMVLDSLVAAEAWFKAGVRRLVFHLECLEDSREPRRKFGQTVELGLAVNNDTPLERLLPALDDFDFVQVMGIKTIGAQGQAYDERAEERIRALRAGFPGLPLVVDGAVSQETAGRLITAGATRLVSGSALFAADDIEFSYKQLLSIMKDAAGGNTL